MQRGGGARPAMQRGGGARRAETGSESAIIGEEDDFDGARARVGLSRRALGRRSLTCHQLGHRPSEAATKMTSSQTTAAPLLQNEHEMEMEMDPVALMRGDGPEERWEAISDLDAFFSRVYEYFHERGLRCILASRIISLLSLAFTIALTVFLFELLNLEGLVNDCRDAESSMLEPHARAGGAADDARLAVRLAVRAADLLVLLAVDAPPLRATCGRSSRCATSTATGCRSTTTSSTTSRGTRWCSGSSS